MWNSRTNYGSGECAVCGAAFVRKIKIQKLCGKPECKKINQKRIYVRSWRKNGKKWTAQKRFQQKSQAKYRTKLEKLLSLKPEHMTMEDHWVKGYYLRHKKEGMTPDEAYQQALKDLNVQKRVVVFRDTMPAGGLVPMEKERRI